MMKRMKMMLESNQVFHGGMEDDDSKSHDHSNHKRIKSGFNELPDEIVLEILSRLDAKQTARICVVSRRLRNLCSSSATYEATPSPPYLIRYDEYNSNETTIVRYKKRSDLMDSAILAFDTDRNGDFHDHSELREWMKSTCRVPMLDTNDRLRNATLTALYLNSVMVSDYCDFRHLLYNLCPNLETLSVEKSPILRATVGGGNLKHLEIRSCQNLKIITLNSASNLVSLKVAKKRNTVKTSIYGEFPKLSSISLEGTLDAKTLSHILSQAPLVARLELKMNLIHELSLNSPLRLLEFSSVKQLKLIFYSSQASLVDIALFIKAFPCLEKLTVMYGRRKGCSFRQYAEDLRYVQYNARWMASYKHQHLRVFEFLGWCGCENEVRFANFVIETAIHLRDLVVDPETPQCRDRSGAKTFEQADLVDKKAVESARQLVEKFMSIKSSRP